MRKMIIAFEILLFKFHRAAVRHPYITLLTFLLATAFLFIGLSKIRFILSVEDMVGEGIPAAETFYDLRKEFSDGFSSTLIVQPSDGSFSKSELCELWKWFSKERNLHSTLKKSFSTFDLIRAQSDSPDHLEYVSFFDLNCDDTNARSEIKKIFFNLNQGPWPILRAPPGTEQIVFQLTFEPTAHHKFGSFDPSVVKSFRTKAEKDLSLLLPSAHLRWIGDADYQMYIQEGLDRSKGLNLSMILLLMALVALLYRTWKAGLVFILSLITAGLWIYGAKGWLNSPFDILSNSLFLILGVSTLEDFIFACQEQKKGFSVLASLRRILVPSFYTSLTTMLGFISLVISDLNMIKRLGYWAAAGTLVEWLLLFIVLPSVWNKWFKNRIWIHHRLKIPTIPTFMDRLISFKPPRALALAGLLVFPVTGYYTTHLTVQDAPEVLFPKDHSYRMELDSLFKEQGWRGYAYLVFLAETPNSIRTEIEARLNSPDWKGRIAHIESVDSILNFLTKDLDKNKSNIVRREFSFTQSRENYISEISHLVEGSERKIIYLSSLDLNFVLNLQSDIKSLCVDPLSKKTYCYLTGKPAAFADLTSRISGTLYQSLFTSLGLVSLVLFGLSLRKQKLKSFPVILASSFWGPAVMIIILGVLAIPVNFITCVFLSVLVGLTGDNAIQYLYGTKGEELDKGIKERAKGSIATAIIMATSSLVFLGAYFDPPKTLGLLLFTGVLASLIGDLWVLSGLSYKTKK